MKIPTLFLFLALMNAASSFGAESAGIFTGHQDIGRPAKAGSAKFDSATGAYVVSGGGSNMWAGTDDFHFVWKEMSGDLTLSARVAFTTPGGNEHRKACLIIRQSMDANSPYVDAALHGSGLTALQCRDTAGGATHEVIALGTNTQALSLEKRGDYIAMSVAGPGEELHSAGGSFMLKLKEPFYVGLAVCAHDNNVMETAAFSDVKLAPIPADAPTNKVLACTLEVITMASGDRRVIYHTRDHIEAPNWSPDGKFFLFNAGGHLYKLPVAGGKPELIDTGTCIRCNNDHGISPDGTMLAISDQTGSDRKSRVSVLPITGGQPRLLTSKSASYFHGWSPDGKTLAFCGERGGEFDVYTIPVDGSTDEKRLTETPGLDDGPDYSPDGQWIYWNSERTATNRMQLFRMKPDGSNVEQITKDEYNNWFPHPSPDGRTIVFLSFPQDVSGHPANKNVILRSMPTAGGNIRELAKLFGGQGTMNVNSWSPNSREVAFVSYQFVGQ